MDQNLDAQEAAKYEALRRELDAPDGDTGFSPSAPREPEAGSDGAPAAPGLARDTGPTQAEMDDAELERQATAILERERDGLQRYEETQTRFQENPVEFMREQLAIRDRELAGQDLINRVAADEEQFRKQDPSYDEACNYLRASRERELAAYYPDRNPHVHALAIRNGYRNAAAMREAIIKNDIATTAMQALQRGESPAAFYRGLADQRGFQSKTKTSTAPRGRAPAGKAYDIGKLADLFTTDPEAADREWERARRAGQLG